MLTHMTNRIKFIIERLLLGGAHLQLLVIAGLIVGVSLSAGFLVFVFSSDYDFLDAAWWAFLRLSDPGYLGDDRGAFLRAVSTAVTILGYVLFMGALIATMTQWLNATIRRFESGLTPISLKGHILILGWTNRTATIVKEIIASQERLRRFLDRIGTGKLRVVILAQDMDARMAHDLREELGGYWKQRRIVLRTGTPLRIEDLRRVDFTRAGVIILPGSDFSAGGASVLDTRSVKALLSISTHALLSGETSLPPLVAELLDGRKLPAARAAYSPSAALIPGDAIISRLLAQTVRHPGLSFIYSQLLHYGEGSQIYVRELPALNDAPLQQMGDCFPHAVLMGVLRAAPPEYRPLLNPPDGTRAEAGDRFVLLAETYGDTNPVRTAGGSAINRSSSSDKGKGPVQRRILVLGWNRKAPVLLEEFASYPDEKVEIDMLSLVPVSEQRETVQHRNGLPGAISVTHMAGDYTDVGVLRALCPERYDTVLLLSSDRLENGEEADAKTILGCLLLRDILPDEAAAPHIITELMDPDNAGLLTHRTGETLISPLLLSHILAHVALRPELNIVFEELFTTGGAEICFRPPAAYGITPAPHLFSDIQNQVAAAGDTALGIRRDRPENFAGSGMLLNPGRATRIAIAPDDQIVVLTTY